VASVGAQSAYCLIYAAQEYVGEAMRLARDVDFVSDVYDPALIEALALGEGELRRSLGELDTSAM
jgi:hypothetical protein